VRVTVDPRPGAIVAPAFVVHFSSGKSFIEPGTRAVLQQAADYARAHPGEKLLIAGHADAGGSEDYNQLLSEQRALAVFAYLTYGCDPEAALAAWKSIRAVRTGDSSSSWARREYQLILQDLGYYHGRINGARELTNRVVTDFQLDQGLAVDGSVGDITWAALIKAYLDQSPLAVPEKVFLHRAWLGLGGRRPVKNTRDAWRPNRRVELLFVRPGAPLRNLANWVVVPAEIGSITVRGSIKLDNGESLADLRYVLIAPDGEYMDGETPSGPNRGRPIPSRTAADGTFAYPDKTKGLGFYTLEVIGPYVARLAGEPASAAKGPHVMKRLESSSDFFDVTVSRR
jgi:hypothetical protein